MTQRLNIESDLNTVGHRANTTQLLKLSDIAPHTHTPSFFFPILLTLKTRVLFLAAVPFHYAATDTVVVVSSWVRPALHHIN